MAAPDETDITILDILQRKGRTRRNELADAVKLSIPSISERLRKLEEHGVIREYAAHLEPKKLGFDITAFINVTVDSSKHYAAFIDHTLAVDEVLEVHAITGSGTHLVKVRTENTSTLEKLLARIQAWSGVTATTTSVVLSTPKETLRLKLKTGK